MRAVDIILKKKKGEALTKEELDFFINGYVNGEIPDYQTSALLMAICFQGLNQEERLNLTLAMLHSGEEVDLSQIEGICVDKHSTGGVGDKTSLAVGPIVAACGLKMAKMSGRGLGHTGGTIDKIESVPGCKTNITSEDFFKQVKEVGLAIISQTKNITPADKKLYALRDVTGTIDSIGLIASSIMSKKIASGAKYIILDVKVGDGAFMKTLDDAIALAKTMVEIGKGAGRVVECVITNMDEPLGHAVGNSLEMIEAIETLKGKGPQDFTTICYEVSSELLIMAGVCKSREEAFALIRQKIVSGEALEKLRLMLKAQGGNTLVISDYKLFEQAKRIVPVKAEKSGYIKQIEALHIGNAGMHLGAGRERKEDDIDHAVGIIMEKKVGDAVFEGDVVAYIYSNGRGEDEAYQEILDAIHIVPEEVTKKKLILGIVK